MRKLLTFVCGFALGVGLLVYFLGGENFLLPLLSAMVTVPLFAFKRKWLRRAAILFLGLTVGLAWCSFYTHVHLDPAEALCGNEISFSAVVADDSADTGYGHRVTVDLLVDGGKIRSNLYYTQDLTLLPGDMISGTAMLQRVAVRFSEGEDLYDISRGVLLTGEAEDLVLQPETTQTLSTVLLRFSNCLRENLYALLPEESAGYFTALTTGDRSGMSYGFRNRLAVAGLYHAVSLSGMHISILMSTLVVFCFGRKRLAAVLGVPMIILFCLLSGGSPATLRAVCMQTILLAGLFVGREYDSPTALAAALLFLLVENPWSLAHWGLQLSFASTVGILLLMPRFSALKIRPKVLHRILQPAFVTLSATVFSAPLMSLYFGLNSLVAPLTNVLALWSVTLSFVGGIAVSLLAFLPCPVARWLAWGLDYLYRWLKLVTDTFSNLPCAAVYGETPLLLAWSYLAYLLLTVQLLMRPKWWLCPLTAAVTLAMSLLLTGSAPDGITALDVGQGQCLLFSAGEDTVLVDCGGYGNETGEDAARYLLSRNITALDALVITHFDSDHCDGVLQLLDRIPVKTVYVQNRTGESRLRDEICAVTPVTAVTEPVALSFAEMSVTLYPAIGGESENNTGVCVLASRGECDILVTGDLNAKAEARLVTGYSLPDLEVLVAGHHGAPDSTGNGILDILRPETVLISVGENSFGHPAAETLERIAASGAVCYTTKDNGNLTVRW